MTFTETYPTIEARFWRKVQKRGVDSCWPWTASLNAKGYGQIQLGPRGLRPALAHRVAYILAFGDIDQDVMVLHRCDNPACVNPAHLFLGTHSDNMADRDAKDRVRHGNRHAFAKVTDRIVRRILELHFVYGLSIGQIRRRLRLKLSPSGVCHITHGRTWRRVYAGFVPNN